LLAGSRVPDPERPVALRPAAAGQDALAVGREGGDAHGARVPVEEAQRAAGALPELDAAVAAQRVQRPAARAEGHGDESLVWAGAPRAPRGQRGGVVNQ